MATADEYASWIVNNADKKGTPEFNTVAAAYKEALAEEQPAPKAETPKPAPVAAAPKKAEPIEGSYGVMGEGIEPDLVHQKYLPSVMNAAPDRATLQPGTRPIDQSPVRPEVRKAIRGKYDSADPLVKGNMLANQGWVGDIARQREDELKRFGKVRKAAPESRFVEKVSPDVNDRTQRLIEAGEKPEFARVAAEEASAAGVEPGEEIKFMEDKGTVGKTDFDFQMADMYRNAPTAVRAGVAGVEGMYQGGLGLMQSFADATGDEERAYNIAQAYKKSRAGVASMGENPSYAGRMFEGAVSSIAQQLPGLVIGTLTGSEAVVLGSMFAQTFGQEYAEGRSKGLDGSDAFARAGLFASFEVLGESFGLKFAMDNIRRAASGMKTSELKEFLGNAIKKELPGEYLTTSGQFLTDWSSIGLNKTATVGDYLQQMADTTAQTLIQSGLMTGGTKAIGKGVEALTRKEEQQQPALDYEQLAKEKGFLTGRPKLTELEAARNEAIELPETPYDPLAGLQAARRPEFEGEPLAPPLTQMEAARNEAIEGAPTPPPAPVAAPVDPRLETLTQAYQDKGYMADDAQRLAQMDLAALTAPVQSFQDTTQQAVRSVLQAEAQNVPSTEPPPYVTEPSADQLGVGISGEPAGRTAGAPSSPLERGLDAARNLIGSALGREEQQRASLEANYKSTANRLAKAFSSQAFPNLAPVFGLAWQQQTMATNPSPEEFQEAAYNKLEELSFLGQRAEGTYEQPAKLKETPSVTEAPKAIEAKEKRPEAPAAEPAASAVKTIQKTLKDGNTITVESVPTPTAFSSLVRDEYGEPISLVAKNDAGEEVGRLTYMPNGGPIDVSVAEKERRRGIGSALYDALEEAGGKLPTEESGVAISKEASALRASRNKKAAPAEFAPLELEAGRKEELEVEETNKALLNIDEHMKKVYGTTATGELRKRGAGAGRPVSEIAKTEEQRKQETKEANQFNRDVNTLLKIAGKYGERQELTAFETREEWEAAEEVRAANLVLVREALYGVSRQPGTAGGVIAAKDYIRNLKPAEREVAQKAYEAGRKAPLKPMEAKGRTEYIAEQQLDMEPDLGFYSIETAKGALTQILDSPNDIEAALAARLLQKDNIKSLENIDFIVVDKTTKIKDKSVKRMLDKGTVGVFVPDTVGGTIYVRGDSYDEQGINNEIVLHEAMHASGSKKIAFAMLAKEQGEPVSQNLAEAVDELQALMERAKATYDNKGDNVAAPLKFLHDKADAFTDIQEFYAYGLTNADMKEFLLNEVPGTTEKTSGFDSFINMLLRLFSIDPKLKSGLKDLVLISHEIMQAKEPEGAKLAAMAATAEVDLTNEAKAKNNLKKTEKEVEAEYAKLKYAKDSKQKLSILNKMAKLSRDPTELGRLLVAKWNRMSLKDMRDTGFLKLLPTDELIKRGTELGIGSLNDVTNTIDKMVTFRVKLLKQTNSIGEKWLKLKAQDAENLADAMHLTTLVGIDPTKDTSSKRVNEVWKPLTKEAKAVYVAVRDWYANNYRLYGQYLQQRVDASVTNAEDKNTLMSAIRVTLEAGSKLAPYFPLMRYGQYWARIGKGEKAIFAMFEDSDSRDAFVQEQMAALAAKGDRRSRDRMFEDNSLDEGNSLAELTNKLPEHNDTIKELFATIDNMKSADVDTKNEFKQEVFQMHLNTMPDESFRKQFLHRKGTAGFTNDALRNFGVLSSKMVNQLARIKYGPMLRNNVSAARASLKGNPDKAKLGMIVDRVEARVDDEISPTIDDSWLAPTMHVITKTAFLWQMTGVKSAVTQLFSLTTHGLPVLWKYHGVGRGTMQSLIDTASMGFGLVGKLKTAPDGTIKYEFPSLKNSLAGSPILQKAYDEFIDSQQNEQTRTADLMGRSKVPSSQYGAIAKTIENGMTFLFHKAESMSREIMYIASFKLNYAKLSKDKNLTEEQKFEKAVANAKSETKEALFNYDKFNTPEAMRPVPLQAVLQYRKFQVFSMTYMLRNGSEMISKLPANQRAGAAKAFFGTAGMTALLGGVTATFTYGMIMSMIQGAINLLHDKDEEMPLEMLNFKKYFENVWLPEKLGGLGNFAAHGLLDTVTGYEMGKGVSQDFWFRDGPEAPNWKSAWLNTAAGLAGPAGGMVSNWMGAIDDFNNGDNLKAFEKITPALFKGIVTDIRYEKEGVRGMGLDPVKDSTKFTQFQYFMQALGYKTAPLAQKLSDNFAIKEIVTKVENERGSLLRKLLRVDELGTQKEFNKVLDKIDTFNAMYPDREIEDEQIDAAFDRREKMLEETERGLYIPEGYEDLEKLGRRSEKALTKEERK